MGSTDMSTSTRRYAGVLRQPSPGIFGRSGGGRETGAGGSGKEAGFQRCMQEVGSRRVLRCRGIWGAAASQRGVGLGVALPGEMQDVPRAAPNGYPYPTNTFEGSSANPFEHTAAAEPSRRTRGFPSVRKATRLALTWRLRHRSGDSCDLIPPPGSE